MSSHLAGKTIAFTGEMNGMTRAQVTRLAQAAGATVTSNVTPKTDFLVCGKTPGPKAATANAMGITMLSQPQFSRFVKNVQVPAAAPAMYQQPMMQQQQPVAGQQYQYPAEYLAMTKAPRGRRPMNATPAMPMPVAQQPVAMPMATPAPAMPKFDNKPVTLAGKTITFTGTLETATRAEAGAMAAQAGAMVGAAITPNTSYLVCGTTPGATKIAAAQTSGVRVISEAQFMKAVVPAVNAMPEAPMMQQPAMPVAQQPMMQQQPAMMKAPRGRRPRSASPAAPMMATPAPMAEVPAYEEPSTGAMPWETEMVGEAAPAAVMAPKPRRGRTPKAAMPVAVPAMPVAQPAMPVAQPGSIVLAGQNIVFTGALQVNRMVAATMASKAGAMVSTALSTKTNLLVCGANAGEKMAKAQSMGIRCISEAEFVAACRQ